MTLFGYYSQVAIPILFVLLIGSVLNIAFRKRSAATKQFICAATLLSGLAVGLVPFLPLSARPVLPSSFPRAITLHPTPYESISVPLNPTAYLPRPTTGFDYIPIVSTVIALISLGLAIRLVGSLIKVSILRRMSTPADDRIQQLSTRHVRTVSNLTSPAALGGLNPMIILPDSAKNWSEEQLKAVLIHEEAHLNNSDPNWQIVAEISCILYWFNPLVWFMRGSMRQAAERAADDAVIRAGIQPSAYAQDLFEIAAKIGRTHQPIAWTTFARKNGVKGRIKAILNSQIERNTMTKSTKIASSFGLAIAAYCTSAYVGQGTPILNSRNKDVREGNTVSAEASTNFKGRLADGREIEVLQISRQLPNGSIIAWKPDGTPLDGSHTIKIKYHPLKRLGTHTRYILVKFPENKSSAAEPNAGLGSADDHPGERPSEMTFAGGGIISHKDGYYTIVSFIELNKEDSSKFSAGFGVGDANFKDLGPISPDNPIMRDVTIKEVNEPRKGDLENEAWWTKHKGPYTLVDYTLNAVSPESIGDPRVVPVFKDPTKKHVEANEFGSFGRYVQNPPENRIEGFESRYYYAYRLSEIKEFRHVTRQNLNCNIFGMAANPNNINP